MVKYSILSATLAFGGGSPPAANPRTEEEKAAQSLGLFSNIPKHYFVTRCNSNL